MEALTSVKRNKENKYVFCNGKGDKYFNLRRSFKTALKKAGLDRECFVFHTLRHTFASHLVMQGVDILTVKELLWHSDIKTTMVYTHLLPKHKRVAVEIGDIIFQGTTAKKSPLRGIKERAVVYGVSENPYNISN